MRSQLHLHVSPDVPKSRVRDGILFSCPTKVFEMFEIPAVLQKPNQTFQDKKQKQREAHHRTVIRSVFRGLTQDILQPSDIALSWHVRLRFKSFNFINQSRDLSLSLPSHPVRLLTPRPGLCLTSKPSGAKCSRSCTTRGCEPHGSFYHLPLCTSCPCGYHCSTVQPSTTAPYACVGTPPTAWSHPTPLHCMGMIIHPLQASSGITLSSPHRVLHCLTLWSGGRKQRQYGEITKKCILTK